MLLVSPSILLVAVFVYGLIGWNIKVSLSDWRQAEETSGFDTSAFEGSLRRGMQARSGTLPEAVATGDQPLSLNTDPAWIIGLHHALLFTVAFVAGALIVGASLAFLLDKGVKGEGMFRAIYLFPMAVSFIAAGVVWRWLMNPAPGDRSTGFNLLFDKLGLGFLRNEWYLAPTGGPLAVPAVWALSGYIMALYLAGFRGVPEELREAARMDGASEWRVYRHVVFPHLRPVTFSALIILGHISIKVFDLIVAIGGKQLITQTPAVYMWILIYDARDYAKGAAIATVLLVVVSLLVIPYMISTIRSERES